MNLPMPDPSTPVDRARRAAHVHRRIRELRAQARGLLRAARVLEDVAYEIARVS